MFYRKTDIEILCDTLIALVNKHDKAIEKNGPQAAYPHAKAVDLLLKKLDEELKRPPMQKVVTVVKKEVRAAGDQVRKTFSNGRRKMKAPITVLHGAADDMKPSEHQINEASKLNEMNETMPTTSQNAPEGPQKEKEVANVTETVTTGDTTVKFMAPDNPPQIHSDGTPKEVTTEVPVGVVTPDNIDSMANQLVD